MEIIAQLLANEAFTYLLEHWRAETMIAIIVFLLTYAIMQTRINNYKQQLKQALQTIEKYEKDVETFQQNLKMLHNNIREIKQILTDYSVELKNQELFDKIIRIIDEKTKQHFKDKVL